jgi:hypothetical protein
MKMTDKNLDSDNYKKIQNSSLGETKKLNFYIINKISVLTHYVQQAV